MWRELSLHTTQEAGASTGVKRDQRRGKKVN